MTGLDHDLVQSVAADEPAITAPASPPRRDPIEDADASFTRKRPRLHSGSNSLRAMSADPQTPANLTPTSAEKQVEMTIRSHPPSSPVRAGDNDDDDGSNAGDFLEDTLLDQNMSPIVIPSSEEDDSRSPPVLLIDDDDAPTVDFSVQLNANDHFARFPYPHLGTYATMVRQLAQHISEGEPTLFCLPYQSHDANTPQRTPIPTAASSSPCRAGLPTSPILQRIYMVTTRASLCSGTTSPCW
jgi:ubiquitin carboxyl-terminal hydrolase 34